VSGEVKPILVTGSHRSGTTWAGRVLAFSPTPLGYIWEPFNPRHRPGTFPIRATVRPNNLVFWECIRRGCEAGAQHA